MARAGIKAAEVGSPIRVQESQNAELQLLGVHMFRYVATILVAILLSAPLVAGITPFPASFHTQMVPTNGTYKKVPSDLSHVTSASYVGVASTEQAGGKEGGK